MVQNATAVTPSDWGCLYCFVNDLDASYFSRERRRVAGNTVWSHMAREFP